MKFVFLVIVFSTHSAMASWLVKPITSLMSKNADAIGDAVTECRALLSHTLPLEVVVARVDKGIDVQIKVEGQERINQLMAPYQVITDQKSKEVWGRFPSFAEILGSLNLGLDWTWDSSLQKFNNEIWRYYRTADFLPGLMVSWDSTAVKSLQGSVKFTRRLAKRVLPNQEVEATLDTLAFMKVQFLLENTKPTLAIRFVLHTPKQISEAVAQSAPRIANDGTP